MLSVEAGGGEVDKHGGGPLAVFGGVHGWIYLGVLLIIFNSENQSIRSLAEYFSICDETVIVGIGIYSYSWNS